MPYPPDRGDRSRAFHLIAELSRRFRIVVCVLRSRPGDRERARALARWTERVILGPTDRGRGTAAGVVSLLAGSAAGRGIFRGFRAGVEAQREARRERFALTLGSEVYAVPWVRRFGEGARVVDLVDADSVKWSSYGRSGRRVMRPIYRREARWVREVEVSAAESFDGVVLVSREEVEAAGLPEGRVIVAGLGVDGDYFSSRTGEESSLPSLVFTGDMGYPPNVEAVCWLSQWVLPRLRRRLPRLTFRIVGRRPSREVRRLASQEGVEVTGEVVDVRPHLARASLAVAPLRYARGVQNKVLEAMAMGKAVVASCEALTGLDLEIGEEILEAGSPEQWTETISRLLEDPSWRESLGERARACVEARFKWSDRLAPLLDLCSELAAAEDRP
jgi:sugar transferase (PEP-CTERM/EpsH1 system associated)